MRLFGGAAAAVSIPAVAQMAGPGGSVIPLGTVQNMLDIDTASLAGGGPHMALVEGYRTPGDGGGGWFRWDPSGTAGIDDFLVFRPRQRGANEPGRWLRIADPSDLSFEMAGATGDGVTDDFAACQKTLLFASRQFGACRVRLRPGKSYLIDHALWGLGNFGLKLDSPNAGALVIPDHCVIEGPGGALSGGERIPALARTARLVLHPQMTVFLSYFAELADLQVMRKDMGGPVDHFTATGPSSLEDMQAQVALWFSEDGRADVNGGVRSIAITNGGINTKVRRVLAMGFHTAYRSDGFSGGDVIELLFDTAGRGVEVTRTADSARIRDCYSNCYWSGTLGVVANPHGDQAARPGVAFDFHDKCDGLRCTDCSAIGWATGFRCPMSGRYAEQSECGARHPAGRVDHARHPAEGVVSHTTIFNPLLDGFTYRIDFQHRPFAKAVSTGRNGQPGLGQYPTASITVIGGSLQANSTDPAGNRMFRLGPYSAGAVIAVNLASYNGPDEKPAILAQAEVGVWKFVAVNRPAGSASRCSSSSGRPMPATCCGSAAERSTAAPRPNGRSTGFAC